MAEKKNKSQAEIAASSKKNNKAADKKKQQSHENTKKTEKKERQLPTRFITATVFLCLFILFLAISLSSGGVLNQLFEDVILGLVGWVGYIVAIPSFLYLFVIHAFSNKRPVVMRSICVGIFVLCCGCMAHLLEGVQDIAPDSQILYDLYIGGSNGSTGGVICGGIAVLVYWLCSGILSWIIFVLGAVFSLFGAMQITIPSIIRAVKDRPRAEWEDEDGSRAEECKTGLTASHNVAMVAED